MNLERVNEEKSEELGLPVGSILLNQMEYVIEVLMKFEPSLQLRTRTTPRNQESFASKQAHHVSTEQAFQEYVDSLQALAAEDIISRQTRSRPVALSSTIILIKYLSIFHL